MKSVAILFALGILFVSAPGCELVPSLLHLVVKGGDAVFGSDPETLEEEAFDDEHGHEHDAPVADEEQLADRAIESAEPRESEAERAERLEREKREMRLRHARMNRELDRAFERLHAEP